MLAVSAGAGRRYDFRRMAVMSLYFISAAGRHGYVKFIRGDKHRRRRSMSKSSAAPLIPSPAGNAFREEIGRRNFHCAALEGQENRRRRHAEWPLTPVVRRNTRRITFGFAGGPINHASLRKHRDINVLWHANNDAT